jgi:hypothetical protein
VSVSNVFCRCEKQGEWGLTKPQSCWNPWSIHAMMSARRFPPCATSCVKLSLTRLILACHPVLSACGTFRYPAASSSSKISFSTFLVIWLTRRSMPSPRPYTLRKTRRAWSLWPALTRYRGVSGSTKSMQNCTAAGNAPRPTIHLQPCGRVEKSHPTIYASTCPPVMNRAETVTSLPLNALGASSLMYMGTTKLALPTAAPTTLLPTIMPDTVDENACIRAPATNRMSAIRMILRRPSVSARTPVRGDAKSAKKEVDDVINDLSRVVRGRLERDVLMDIKVEEITPVLQRNCQPKPSHDCVTSGKRRKIKRVAQGVTFLRTRIQTITH